MRSATRQAAGAPEMLTSLALLLLVSACAPAMMPPASLPTPQQLQELWVEPFIRGVGDDGVVKFDYHGRQRELLQNITPEDVRRTARLFAQLSDKQLHDAFRAAAYAETHRTRFVMKLKSKIQEGLALERRATALP